MTSTKSTSLRKRFELRLDEQTAKDLDYCSNTLKISKTEVVKKGIVKVKEDIKK